MKTFLNFDNKQNSYPDLFLGADLGLNDNIHITYPELDEAAIDMRSKFWTENEVNLSADKLQWATLPEKTKEIFKLNLSWQSFLDTLVARAPEQTLLSICSNPELEFWYQQQVFNETIHARTYMHIIRTVFPNPEEVMDELRNNNVAIKRAKVIVHEFDVLYNMVSEFHLGIHTFTEFDLKVQVFKTLAVLFVLEGVQFFSSFAMNFSLSEQGIMSGCSDFLRLIARDEVLHRNTGLKVIQILLKNPEWAKAYEVAKPEIERLFYEAVESELGWADYVLTGRELIGMNASLLKDFIHYIASHLTTPLGFKYKLKEVNTNPISWFDDYLDSAALQVAPQERENTNYVISSVSNDEEFDLEF